MKTFLILIVSLSIALTAVGQDYPDSARPDDSVGRGFTNKAEAKNLKINGKKEGKWFEYMVDDGNKIVKDSSKARFYRLAVYKDDKLNGIARAYYKDGQLHSTVRYCDNKKNGDYKFYDSGYVVLSVPFVDDMETGVEKFYPFPGDSSDIGVFEIPYIDGKKNGVEKMYYKNGKIMAEDTIINGKKKGKYRAYYESGKIEMEVPFTNGKANGWKKWYYESGKLEGEEPWSNGKIDGMEKHYYEDGKLKSVTIYHNDKAGEPKNYDENGNEIK